MTLGHSFSFRSGLTSVEIDCVQRKIGSIEGRLHGDYKNMVNIFHEEILLVEHKVERLEQYLSKVGPFIQSINKITTASASASTLTFNSRLSTVQKTTVSAAQVPVPVFGLSFAKNDKEKQASTTPSSSPRKDIETQLDVSSKIGISSTSTSISQEITFSSTSPSKLDLNISSSSSPPEPFHYESESVVADTESDSPAKVPPTSKSMIGSKSNVEDSTAMLSNQMSMPMSGSRSTLVSVLHPHFDGVKLDKQKQLVRFSTDQIRRSNRGLPSAILMEGFFQFEIYGKTIPLRLVFIHFRSPAPGSVAFGICFPYREHEKDDDYYGNYEVTVEILNHQGSPVITKVFDLVGGSGSCDLETESTSIHMGCKEETYLDQDFLTPEEILVLNDQCLLSKRKRPNLFIMFQARIQFILDKTQDNVKHD